MRNRVLQQYARNAFEAEYPQLWQGMVFGWSANLGITGGMIRDRSGRANHGTLTNMDPATDWVRTERGLALDFDGSNDAISGSPIKGSFESITVAIRFYNRSNNGASAFRNRNAGTTATNLSWTFYSFGSFARSFMCSAGTLHIGTTGTLNVWTQWIVTCHQGVLRWYENGNQIGSFVGSGNAMSDISANELYLMLQANALVEDIRFYGRALSPAEIALDYSLGPGGWAQRRRRRVRYSAPIRPTLPRTRSITSSQCVDFGLRWRNIGHGRLSVS